MKKNFFYLITLEYLGFRYHGWQKQKDVKTVQLMLDKTLKFVLGEEVEFKTLAAGRTDAMVSSLHSVVELFSTHELNVIKLTKELNHNLPVDMRINSIDVTDENFLIMDTPRIKHYAYYFCFKDKPHPFCAPIMTFIREDLDITLMQEAVKLFIGEHYYGNYIYQPNPQKKLWREIISSEITTNTDFIGSYFPKTSYVFKVSSPGFGRYQVRNMMGSLFQIGMGQIDIETFKKSLQEGFQVENKLMAPASGLVLTHTDFITETQ